MINLKVNDNILQNIDLIIFDKDGTLFELYSYWSVIANKRAEIICASAGIPYNMECRDHIAYIMGVDNQNKCMRPNSMIGINKRSEIEYELLWQLNDVGIKLSLDAIKKAFVDTDAFIENNFISNYNNDTQTTTPILGVIEFLNMINGRCKCAVLSFDRTTNINNCLNSVGIGAQFSIVIGGDMLHNAKPDPEGAIKIMESLKISPEHTLFIGDTLNDIRCGINAKCAHTLTRKSELSQINEIKKLSDLIINDFTEIEVLS